VWLKTKRLCQSPYVTTLRRLGRNTSGETTRQRTNIARPLKKDWSVPWKPTDGQERKIILLMNAAIFCHELLRLSPSNTYLKRNFYRSLCAANCTNTHALVPKWFASLIHGEHDLVWWIPAGHLITNIQSGNNIGVRQRASQWKPNSHEHHGSRKYVALSHFTRAGLCADHPLSV
jgi:hypothetical protein